MQVLFFLSCLLAFFSALLLRTLDNSGHPSLAMSCILILIANSLHRTLKASFQRFNGSCPCRTASPHIRSRPASSYYAAALDAVCVTAAGPDGSQSASGSSLCTARIRSQAKMFCLYSYTRTWLAGASWRGEVRFYGNGRCSRAN
jgi:hypothetical protein